MFNRLWGLIKKEFLTIWRDPKSRMILIVPPIIQFVLFANLLTMETKNIDVVIADFDNSVESRELIAGFKQSRWFGTVFQVDNLKDIETQIKSQKSGLGIIINNDFSRNIKKGKEAPVQVILDGRTTATAAGLSGYTAQIAALYEANSARQHGINPSKINIEHRSWFNPNAIYQWYLVISLIEMLALVITLILTALSIARERETGTFEQLIVSPYSAIEILIGKTIPPLGLVLILITGMTGAAIFFFEIPFTGSFPLFLGSAIIALLSFVGVGLFISSITKNQQQAVLGAFAFMMPAILLSGFVSPIEDMPPLFQYITYLNPVRFFLNIAKGIFLKDMMFLDVLSNLVPLILMAIVTLSFAAHTFKRNLE